MWAEKMVWRNPPVAAEVRGGALVVITGAETDYWRETFYGFTHDNGHHLTTPGGDSFTAELHFSAAYQAQYDQAGLMLWADGAHWVKTGIEWVNGQAHVACVVTVGKSDWSQMPVDLPAEGLRLRLHRKGDAIWVQVWTGKIWRMVRLAHFPEGLAADVGPMACSPSRAGLEVTFHDFTLGPFLDEKAY